MMKAVGNVGVAHWVILATIALAARLAFIAFLPADAYSADVENWRNVAGVLAAGGNPYNVTDHLNWPPFWMQAVFVMASVARVSGLDFITVLRAVLVVCELAVLLLTYGLIRRLTTPSLALRLVLALLALNPVAILLNCQHGNFDVFVALFVLLAVVSVIAFAENGDSLAWLWACAFLGLGLLAKTVPIVLTPLLAFGFRRVRWTARLLG